jgi:SAM-dependent methyltransferase
LGVSVLWDAAIYEAVRPSYPAEMVEWCRPAPDGLVVELGAGTGKLTTLLVAAGFRVRPFEPSPEMRAAWSIADIAVDDAAAESIPLDDESAAVVVAAQAAHWFDRSRALPEIARVLAPGGRIVLIWNQTDTSDPWTRDAFAIAKSMSPPTYEVGIDWGAELAEHFDAVGQRSVSWSIPTTTDALVAQVASRSYVANASNRDQILAAVAAVPVPDGARLGYTTVAWTACRR